MGIIADFWYALRCAVRPVKSGIQHSLLAFRYAWFKRRKEPDTLKTRVPLQGLPQEELTEHDIPQDEPEIVLYRDDTGKLFTQEMIDRGEQLQGGIPIKIAVEISDERAQELLEYLDQVRMDRDLSPDEVTILKVIRNKLFEEQGQRWVI